MEKREFLVKCNNIVLSAARNIFDKHENDIKSLCAIQIPQEEGGSITFFEYVNNMGKDVGCNINKDIEIPDSVINVLDDEEFINKILDELEKLFCNENIVLFNTKKIDLITDVLISICVNIFPESKKVIQKYMKLIIEGSKPEIDPNDITTPSNKEIFVVSIFTQSISKLMYLASTNFQLGEIISIIKEV